LDELPYVTDGQAWSDANYSSNALEIGGEIQTYYEVPLSTERSLPLRSFGVLAIVECRAM